MKKEKINTFGKRLKELRQIYKKTQKELAKETGIAYRSIINYENENRSPSGINLAILEQYFGVTGQYLLGNENSNNVLAIDFLLEDNEKKLIDRYRLLPMESKQFIDYLINREYKNAIKNSNSTFENIREIPYYIGKVSAGSGNVMVDEVPHEIIQIDNTEDYKKVSYAISVSGDSMEPKYYDGDILFVEVTEFIEIGEIGIFSLNGDSYVKKRGENCLISINNNYPEIPLNDTIRCLGKIVDKLQKN